MSSLDANALFEAYLFPLYPDDVRADLARARASDANPSGNPTLLAHIDDAAARFAALVGRELELDFDGSDASVFRLSHALTREVRDRWACGGEGAGSADSPLFNVLVHGALYVGACAVKNHGGRWLVRRPLWESLVRLESRAGEAHIPPLHWFLKALSDDEVGKGTLGDRYRTYVTELGFAWESLPVLRQSSQALPRLKGSRYDLFFKYLRAHLAEIRDLGQDFPSPERFDELQIKWLDAHWVGGGRLCLLVMLGASGLHLIWLDAQGFRKSLYVPCETFPEPIVRVRSDEAKGDLGAVLELVTSQEGKVVTQEFMWWGP
jgi:hypothetical protein